MIGEIRSYSSQPLAVATRISLVRHLDHMQRNDDSPRSGRGRLFRAASAVSQGHRPCAYQGLPSHRDRISFRYRADTSRRSRWRRGPASPRLVTGSGGLILPIEANSAQDLDPYDPHRRERILPRAFSSQPTSCRTPPGSGSVHRSGARSPNQRPSGCARTDS